MFWEKISFNELTLCESLSFSLLLSLIYVLSLYIWKTNFKTDRNEPDVIKRRFISVILASFVSLVLTYSKSTHSLHGFTFNEWIGFRQDGLFRSIISALFLISVLFAGPIVQFALANYSYYKRYGWRELVSINSLKDVQFWRNYVISPCTEELVFRSCVLSLLFSQLKFTKLIVLGPSLFGLAHLHHILEGYFLKKLPLSRLIQDHLFQFAYTWLFGIISSYLFLRTGHFMASFVAHAFCNLLGFPDLNELFTYFDKNIRNLLILIYFLGLISFFYLTPLMTEPHLFNNKIFY